MAIAAILITVAALRIVSLERELQELRTGLATEVERQNTRTQYLESNQRQATTHLRQVRELLNLSPGAYRFPGEDDTAASPGAEDDGGGTDPAPRGRAPQIIAAIDRLRTEQDLERLSRRLADTLPPALEPRLPANTTLRSSGRLRWVVERNDTSLVTLLATPDQWVLAPALGETTELSVPDADPAADAVLATVAEETRRLVDEGAAVAARYAELQAAVSDAFAADRIRVRTEELALLATPLRPLAGNPWEAAVRVRAIDADDDLFGVRVTAVPPAVTVDGTPVTLDGAPTAAITDAVLARLDRIDPRTAGQRAVDRAVAEIRQALTDPGVQAALEAENLRVATELRESIDFFYLDFIGSDGRTGAIAVQKDVGTVYLTDAHDVVVTTLDRAADDPLAAVRRAVVAAGTVGAAAGAGAGDRSLPEDFPPGFRGGEIETTGSFILLIGTHEQRADAMVLAYLSPERTISMISIPRDIWWQGRKLSYHAEIYGIDHLVEQVSAITAQAIDGWVAVDMYAFVEVVDLLGGIEVTLDEPLIDPTYRVRENGAWSTLAYSAGTHHLGGIEALRLARSRHTSNDFERAARQQQILSALRDRLNRLNAGDLDQVYSLLDTLATYVSSSYSLWEMAQLYLAYRTAPIVRRTGLTFDNVLYNTWSNLYLQGLNRSEVDDSFYLGEWILLPRDDNWAVIPWFVENNLR